jgi:hypothetical protein
MPTPKENMYIYCLCKKILSNVFNNNLAALIILSLQICKDSK